jgi:urease accessory protein
MLRIEEVLPAGAEGAADGLTLPFDLRRKSRQRVVLDSGEEAALVLPRGTILKEGDRLRASDGRVVVVRAALETVSVVAASDPRQLARAAYHLGNRHLPVEVTAAGLQYQHDHVIDDMIVRLGLTVRVAQERFEPEAGAYGGGHGHGGHDHDHDGESDHDHGHGHVLLDWRNGRG